MQACDHASLAHLGAVQRANDQVDDTQVELLLVGLLDRGTLLLLLNLWRCGWAN